MIFNVFLNNKLIFFHLLMTSIMLFSTISIIANIFNGILLRTYSSSLKHNINIYMHRLFLCISYARR